MAWQENAHLLNGPTGLYGGVADAVGDDAFNLYLTNKNFKLKERALEQSDEHFNKDLEFRQGVQRNAHDIAQQNIGLEQQRVDSEGRLRDANANLAGAHAELVRAKTEGKKLDNTEAQRLLREARAKDKARRFDQIDLVIQKQFGGDTRKFLNSQHGRQVLAGALESDLDVLNTLVGGPMKADPANPNVRITFQAPSDQYVVSFREKDSGKQRTIPLPKTINPSTIFAHLKTQGGAVSERELHEMAQANRVAPEALNRNTGALLQEGMAYAMAANGVKVPHVLTPQNMDANAIAATANSLLAHRAGMTGQQGFDAAVTSREGQPLSKHAQEKDTFQHEAAVRRDNPANRRAEREERNAVFEEAMDDMADAMLIADEAHDDGFLGFRYGANAKLRGGEYAQTRSNIKRALETVARTQGSLLKRKAGLSSADPEEWTEADRAKFLDLFRFARDQDRNVPILPFSWGDKGDPTKITIRQIEEWKKAGGVSRDIDR